MMKMESQIRLVNVENIIPNRFQPRLVFDEEGLNELCASIKEHGIIQPLVLRRVNDKFEIIAGERRFKASQMAGLTEVPAIITNLDDNESAEVAIIENTHRRNLSAIEEAKSYKKLLDRKYVTQDQLAKRLGKSQSGIANKLRLLTLDDNVQEALIKEQISERHARSLLRLTDKAKQVEFLNKVIEERWPVKRLDDEIDSYLATLNKTYNGSFGLNKMDLDVLNEKENTSNDLFDIPSSEYKPKYEYQGRNKDDKKSVLFNSLENQSANMSPSIDLGFNLFDKDVKTQIIDDDMLDVLDIDSNEEETEINKTSKKIKTRQDVEDAIKDILKQAKDNQIDMEVEEFNFNKMNQFIIRLDKEE